MARRNHDELFLAQALELARKGVGLTSPNPCVGAIIVDERGRIVGRGFHTYEGVKHAEVLAIEEAGEQARGNTLYLNLEPCSHTGRTGPCADAVIAAGIHRVVAGMRDPNPLVSGKGFEKLRAAGIEVVEGVLEHEAKKLNESFARYIRAKMPLGILKTAMTLDGKISAGPGVSQNPTALGASHASTSYITGEKALKQVHELRHSCDAIMVGVGTVIADDPMLTDRSGKPRRRRLVRVILDSRLRLPLESRLVQSCENDVVVFCSFSEEKKRSELEKRGVRVEQVPLAVLEVVGGKSVPAPHDGRPNMQQVFARLAEMENISVLVEGGAMVNWACLQADIIDKVWLFYAAKILGGTDAIPFLWSGFGSIQHARQIKELSLHRYGDDFAVEGYIHNPYD